MLNVENLVDYLLALYFCGDGASPISKFLGNACSNNWYAIRDQSGFQFLIPDSEHVLGTSGSRVDSTGPFLHANQEKVEFSNPQWIHQDLMAKRRIPPRLRR